MVDNAANGLAWEGKISQAARMKKEHGEYLEDQGEIELAAKAFTAAGRLFEKEDLS